MKNRMNNVFLWSALAAFGLMATAACSSSDDNETPEVPEENLPQEQPLPEGYVQKAAMQADASLAGGDWNAVNNYMKKLGWEYSEHPNAVKDASTGEDINGKHIEVVNDETLGQPVFRFTVHKNEQMTDGDRGSKKDRQRNEMKTRVSGSNMAQYKDVNGNYGEWQILEWKFKIPAGFQPSTAFTHIHQLKGFEGDNIGSPIITLSLRANSDGSNRRVQLIHTGRTSATTQGTVVDKVPISEFEDQWVQVRTEAHFCRKGYYAIRITRLSDGKVLMDYTNTDIDLWRDKGTANVRSKFGIYRNVGKDPFGSNPLLKDESLYLADFKVYEKDANPDPQPVDD